MLYKRMLRICDIKLSKIYVYCLKQYFPIDVLQ